MLAESGHDDVVEEWLCRTGAPSYHEMLSSGSGALAEQFREGEDSYNHAMFSSYVMWLYQSLAGVRVAEDAVCADKLDIRPYFSRRTDGVSSELALRKGTVRTSWTRTEGVVEFSLELPEDVDARVMLPEGAVAVGGEDGCVRRWTIQG